MFDSIELENDHHNIKSLYLRYVKKLEAYRLTELLARKGFHLTKWVSNSPKVFASIPEGQRSESGKGFDQTTVQQRLELSGMS